ncbi:peptidase M48, Ste24p [Luminiphilus syltensis NOR5-1B]|uniref:Peptidase M48, Ste24p n=1 Tax=Luminiphilus syltensis NOR5-1B TaxID=565045 RepID=B8KTL3_9GAMM|nr:M48 family metallopeptidase [Luminiphilus syltensis]EED36128.1 peptidase M48, Ste24p [Luminiphilus syltensis NOR5-1B]
MRYRQRIIALALFIATLMGCSTSPTGRSQLMLISPEAAIVQSEAAYLSTVGELAKDAKLVDDPAMVDRVARITGRVVTTAIEAFPHSADWKWSVAIIDDPETVNAWCMAGGRMAAYTGLFEKLKLTDDEFAQIMGHEIAHALANHTAERMSRAMATSLGVVAVGVSSDNGGLAMTGAALAAKYALELPNSRTAESEADTIGMRLATEAGYDPEAAVTLWQKMGDLSEERPPEFLSTHPAPENRQAALDGMIPEMRALNTTRTKAAVHPVDIVRQTAN